MGWGRHALKHLRIPRKLEESWIQSVDTIKINLRPQSILLIDHDYKRNCENLLTHSTVLWTFNLFILSNLEPHVTNLIVNRPKLAFNHLNQNKDLRFSQHLFFLSTSSYLCFAIMSMSTGKKKTTQLTYRQVHF